MNKPSWENAPEWANYLAMDRDRSWWWHELEPHSVYGGWGSDGNFKRAKLQDFLWKNSVEKRPS